MNILVPPTHQPQLSDDGGSVFFGRGISEIGALPYLQNWGPMRSIFWRVVKQHLLSLRHILCTKAFFGKIDDQNWIKIVKNLPVDHDNFLIFPHAQQKCFFLDC